MAYIGPEPAESFTSFATQEFSTSATTSYTLDHAVANENEIALFVNNVRQQPGSGKAYTATGTALTLSAATASTDTMYCVFLGRALQTVTPATNSITAAMVSNNLISGKDALTSSPDDTDELLISDAGTLKRIDVSLVGGKNTPNFEATKTDSNQSINHDTATKVTFNNETFDSASAFASDKFTVPSGQGGKYFIYTSIAWNNDDNGRRAVFLYKNGSETKRLYETDAGSTDAAHVSAGALLNLSASDYIEVYCYQTTGSAENVLANNEMTYFGGFKIIE